MHPLADVIAALRMELSTGLNEVTHQWLTDEEREEREDALREYLAEADENEREEDRLGRGGWDWRP